MRRVCLSVICFFFFQAEDGIRDLTVTGVQTCALPIYMPIAQEEIFGPAAPILTFDTEEEVIRRANATKFGLAAYFYTRDMTRLVRAAEPHANRLGGANEAARSTPAQPSCGRS